MASRWSGRSAPRPTRRRSRRLRKWRRCSMPRPRRGDTALLSGVIGRDGQYAGWSDPANFTDAEGTVRYILNPDVQIPNWLGFTASAVGLTNPLNREQAVEAYEAFRRWGVQPSSAADVYDG